MIERTIAVERIEDVINVFGSFDQNLRIIENEYHVTVLNRDNELRISGDPEAVLYAEKAVNGLLALAAGCLLAWFGGNLFQVAVLCCLMVLAAEFFLI